MNHFYLTLAIVFLFSFVFWLGTKWAFHDKNDRRMGYQTKHRKNMLVIVELVLTIACVALVSGALNV